MSERRRGSLPLKEPPRSARSRPEPSLARTTFRGAVADYSVHLQAAGRSASTLESYAGSLKLLARSFGTGSLQAITARILDRAVAHIARTCGASGFPASEVTMNRHRSAYRGFFSWAFRTGRIRENPAVLLHLARVDSPPTVAITPRETCRLLATIRRSDDPLRLRDEALFATYALTGMRRSEALCLGIRDYDHHRRMLLVSGGKGRSVRAVPVPAELARLLGGFCRNCPADEASCKGKLFPGGIAGRALTARQVHARFQHWKILAGLRPELSIHSFRAGFATTLYRGSGDVVMVSRALGHRDLRPTLRYIEPFPEKLRQAVERCFAGVMKSQVKTETKKKPVREMFG